MNGGETRLFPLRAAAHSGKKAGFLSRANIEDLWLGTYLRIITYPVIHVKRDYKISQGTTT
ncbi:Uncharacterized protein dnm_023440 [Desulfonema magnum]|uniref:Uncharacterized protein n=1 Tax=Desulfonema magnum TaxID=45655 RepID=A0A975GM09_9BACT|nr:Uncharacterized protein dnm_023440 [Desulfonema magnum]